MASPNDEEKSKRNFDRNCPIDEKCIIRKGDPYFIDGSATVLSGGKDGCDGSAGKEGPIGNKVGNPHYLLITPTDSTTVIPLDPNEDIIAIDTSNFSPIVTLGAPTPSVQTSTIQNNPNCNSSCNTTRPTCNPSSNPIIPSCKKHFLEIKLLYQWGLPVQIQLISGGTFEISAANPNVLLFWNCDRWNIIDNPDGISSFLPNTAKPVVALIPSDYMGPAQLGNGNQDVALSADGTTLAVGAANDNNGVGATWIFIRSPSTFSIGGGIGSWTQQSLKIIGSGAIGNALQGTSVALSADGNTLAIGGPGDNAGVGATWIFVRASNSSTGGGIWMQQAKLIAAGTAGTQQQGTAIALSADGNTLAVSAPADNLNEGGVFIFVRSNGFWSQQGPKLVGDHSTGGSMQGTAVALSADGNTLAFSSKTNSTNTGATWVFIRSYSPTMIAWFQQGPKLLVVGATGPPQQGSSLSLSADGNTLAIGGPQNSSGAGAVWIWIRVNHTTSDISWIQQAGPLFPVQPAASPITTNPLFGSSVALSADGNTLVAGGPSDSSNIGAVWLFRRLNGFWSQFGLRIVGTPATSGENQGTSVALSSDASILAITAPGANLNVGEVFVFQ
jgi:hypothetical protein